MSPRVGWESQHTMEASVVTLKHACQRGRQGLMAPLLRRAIAGAEDISVFQQKVRPRCHAATTLRSQISTPKMAWMSTSTRMRPIMTAASQSRFRAFRSCQTQCTPGLLPRKYPTTGGVHACAGDSGQLRSSPLLGWNQGRSLHKGGDGDGFYGLLSALAPISSRWYSADARSPIAPMLCRPCAL